MRRMALGASLIALALLRSPLTAQSLPDLFQKLKSQVNARAWGDALKTLGTLKTEAARPGNEKSFERLQGPMAFYRGVCEANLGQTEQAVGDFAEFLQLEPSATIDVAVHTKKAVAAFDQARTLTARRAPSIAEAYRTFEPVPQEEDAADQRWADGPVQWILTADEQKEWAGLSEPNARVAFVERFWKSREALPGVGERTYRQEFERRVAFADATMAEEKEKRGSLTDRGMVFVLLGPPAYATRQFLRDGAGLDTAGLSRVESQDQKLALKNISTRGGGAPPTSAGSKAEISARYVGPEHRALPVDDDFLEVWTYDVTRLPAGVPYTSVDVHYVTKKSGKKSSLQPDTATRSTLGAARSQAAPRSR